MENNTNDVSKKVCDNIMRNLETGKHDPIFVGTPAEDMEKWNDEVLVPALNTCKYVFDEIHDGEDDEIAKHDAFLHGIVTGYTYVMYMTSEQRTMDLPLTTVNMLGSYEIMCMEED